MQSLDYPIPSGVHAIQGEQLDLRPDAEIDEDLMNPSPTLPGDSEKNVWFFWHSGFQGMHPYTQRNVRAWHRRFSKQGWTIRVMNRVPDSPLNIANFVDINDPKTFPLAFRDGTIGGDYAPQHTSDLVRWPLLLRYGGAYADVGLMQIGDLDAMWNATVADPDSPYEIMSFNAGEVNERSLTNYFFCCRRGNPLFERAQRLLLALWEGRVDTEGMHASPLLRGVPMMGVRFGEVISKELTDYIIQGQCLNMGCEIIDDEDGWDGPKYCAERIYAVEYMVGSQLINEYTAWDGPEAFRLMSLEIPKTGEEESADQAKAREIVENCLARSFAFKLAHGIIIKVLGDTLGSLWRKHTGSDDVPGTYAHWLRYGLIHWCPDILPPRMEFEVLPPIKRGPLLREG